MAAETLEKTEQQVFNRALQEKLKSMIDGKKVDITTIARGINKSPTTISLYLSSKYAGRVDTLEKDLNTYLNTLEKSEKAELKSLEFVETSIVKRIFNAANMCQMRGKMGVCYGAPGIGKTTTINAYKKQTSGVIVIDPCENISARTVLRHLADYFNLPYLNNTTQDEYIEMVSKKLDRNRYLIIVDEAENLRIECFKALRKIYDNCKDTCGLLFVGTGDLYSILLGIKNGFPYISSRIGYLEQLDALNPDDIEKLVHQYFPDCDNVLLKTIAKVCNRNARSIQNLLDLCLDITKSAKIELNLDVIEAAKGKLLL